MQSRRSIAITELSRSNVFMDSGGDGLLRRTAWAGAGDGVLFYDSNGDGLISEKREYIFTEWDPTATSDMEALRTSRTPRPSPLHQPPRWVIMRPRLYK